MTMIVVTHEMRCRSVSSRTIFLDGGVIGEDKPSRAVPTPKAPGLSPS